jgi:hypothetical protein
MITENTNRFDLDKHFINLELLPPLVQQELIDYYLFLVNKYITNNEKNTKKEEFFQSVNLHRYTLPKDYKFDRDLANER